MVSTKKARTQDMILRVARRRRGIVGTRTLVLLVYGMDSHYERVALATAITRMRARGHFITWRDGAYHFEDLERKHG
jgi:hypothetical protein